MCFSFLVCRCPEREEGLAVRTDAALQRHGAGEFGRGRELGDHHADARQRGRQDRQAVRDGHHRHHRPRLPRHRPAPLRRPAQDHSPRQGQQRDQGLQHQVRLQTAL